MRLYFDTAYLAKCYWNEPGGQQVRDLARSVSEIHSSAICIAEMACVTLRKIREGSATPAQAAMSREWFADDLKTGVIRTAPVTERLLRRVDALTQTLPPACYLRAIDAIHLATAADAGFTEIWTNDRHMLAAAIHVGLSGRSV